MPFPTPGDLPNPGIEPKSLASPVLAGRFFTIAPPGAVCKCEGVPETGQRAMKFLRKDPDAGKDQR